MNQKHDIIKRNIQRTIKNIFNNIWNVKVQNENIVKMFKNETEVLS